MYLVSVHDFSLAPSDRAWRAVGVPAARLRVRILSRHGVLLELSEYRPALEALLEVVVLVRIDEQQVLPAI